MKAETEPAPVRPHLASLMDDFRRLGEETAVVRYRGIRRRATSYGELAVLAARFAAWLEAEGVEFGERVVLWGANSAEWMAVFYGCMLRGAIVVPLDAYGTPDFAERVIADVDARVVVADPELLTHLGSERRTLPLDALSSLPPAQARPHPALGRDTPLQILFTSGTTGDPKGVVHTHGNILSSIEPVANGARPYLRYERLVHPLRFLHTLPLSHVFGQTMGLWVPAIFGAEVHYEDRLVASRMTEHIRRARISVLVAVPRVLALLKQALESEHPALAAQLAAARGIPAAKRWWRFRAVHRKLGLKFWAVVTGGSAVPRPLEEFWNGLGFVLVQGYGMTETSALVTLNHPFHVARGSIGKPLPGREVKLGADGEILVRGPMISSAIWSRGAMRPSAAWLETGDLAEAEPSGGLRFLGRKSAVIVTSAGVNLHPEDMEAALDQEPEVAASVVLGVDGPLGPEPCAVLALRHLGQDADAVVRAANGRLADFQRLRRWMVWPEPDLPRTASGKVKRAAVAAWLKARIGGAGAVAPTEPAAGDWLLTLITEVTGGVPAGDVDQPTPRRDDDVALDDLGLDSLGRVQLYAAFEQRMGMPPDARAFAEAQTLGQLRGLVAGRGPAPTAPQDTRDALPARTPRPPQAALVDAAAQPHSPTPPSEPIYPRWPWTAPLRAARFLFQEWIARPLVGFLAKPRVHRSVRLDTAEPMLIIANHVTAYDVPLLLYALPPAIRRRTAVAMSGEMLEDFRRARNLKPRWISSLGPIAWLLITALYNVFPMPRRYGVQRSFEHIGKALDRGFHVIVFPEGRRSAEGHLARFEPGIGLLARQSYAAVLPMALRGLGELKQGGRDWFRSGTIEIEVGRPESPAAGLTEQQVAEHLHARVAALLRKSADSALP